MPILSIYPARHAIFSTDRFRIFRRRYFLANGGNDLYSGARPSLQWDDSENILGQIDTPAWGNACPILIGNRLIYTAEPADLICADSKTGKLLWQDSNAYEDVTAFTTTERAAGIKDDFFSIEFPDAIAEVESDGLKQIWHADVSKGRYYASPLVHEGLVCIFSMGQVFQVLEVSIGKLVYSKKIQGRMERTFPRLLLVNRMIYANDENGIAFFSIQAGSTKK